MREKKRLQVNREVIEEITRSAKGRYWVRIADTIMRPATKEEAKECEAAGGLKRVFQKSWDLWGHDLETIINKQEMAVCNG